MIAFGAIVVLCATTLAHSAPLGCENLLRPLDRLDPRSLEGRWSFVAGSLTQPMLLERLRQRASSTASFSNGTSETLMVFSRRTRADSKCHYMFYNITLEGGRFAFDNGSVHTTFVRTSCPDCILMSSDVESGKRLHFYLFSRRRRLERKEMEEFRAQVECLRLPPYVEADPDKELCPEQGRASQT